MQIGSTMHGDRKRKGDAENPTLQVIAHCAAEGDSVADAENDLLAAAREALAMLRVIQPHNYDQDGSIIPGDSERIRRLSKAIAKAEPSASVQADAEDVPHDHVLRRAAEIGARPVKRKTSAAATGGLSCIPRRSVDRGAIQEPVVLAAFRATAEGIVFNDGRAPGTQWDAIRARPEGMSRSVFSGCLEALAAAGLYVSPVITSKSHGLVRVAEET